MGMNGRIIVTGATGSMGAAAVEYLAAEGRPVLMACRNLAKAGAVRADILSRVPEADLEIRQLDLASLSSVHAFAQAIEPGSVVALFNNAGVISKGYHPSEDGFENTFAVNYFGPWLLTRLLLPKLPTDARIVNMVSLTYARAKRALLSFSLELARRYPDLRVNLADPGIVASDMIDLGHWFDPLADFFFKPLCKTPKAGVQPALRALAAAEGNHYYVGKKCREIPRRYIDPALDARIWAATEQLISVSA